MLRLADDANKISSSLPYGKEKKVEIARALCGDKLKMICLDEPAAGLNSVETEELSQTIQDIRDKLKITIFLIEHDMSLVMDISDYLVVLDNGKVIAKGSPKILIKRVLLPAPLAPIKQTISPSLISIETPLIA